MSSPSNHYRNSSSPFFSSSVTTIELHPSHPSPPVTCNHKSQRPPMLLTNTHSAAPLQTPPTASPMNNNHSITAVHPSPTAPLIPPSFLPPTPRLSSPCPSPAIDSPPSFQSISFNSPPFNPSPSTHLLPNNSHTKKSSCHTLIHLQPPPNPAAVASVRLSIQPPLRQKRSFATPHLLLLYAKKALYYTKCNTRGHRICGRCIRHIMQRFFGIYSNSNKHCIIYILQHHSK